MFIQGTLEVIYGIYYLRIYKMQKISNVLRYIYERGRVQHVNATYAACLKWILTNNCINHNMYARPQTINSVFKRFYICITCDHVSIFFN